MEREISGGGLFRGNLTLGEFARIPIRNFFICLVFSFTYSILSSEILRVIFRSKFSPGSNCPEDVSVGRGIFLWRWSQIS